MLEDRDQNERSGALGDLPPSSVVQCADIREI